MSTEADKIFSGAHREAIHSSNGTDEAPADLFNLQSAIEIAEAEQGAAWLLADLVEANALLLMFGELGSLKSFLALDWALRIADAGQPVLYLHAEGRGLWKRLRAWARHHYPDIPWRETWRVYRFMPSNGR